MKLGMVAMRSGNWLAQGMATGIGLWSIVAGIVAQERKTTPGGTVQGRVSVRGTSPNQADRSGFVIWVDDIEGYFPPPAQHAVLDQQNLRFIPHVLAIQVGTTVDFPNRDPLSHNVFSISEAKRFNLGLYSGGQMRSIRFDRPGVVELLCNVHVEMSGYIVVVKNPYFARTGSDGSYHISGLPAGQHRLRCWYERNGEQERSVEAPRAGSVTVDFLVGK